MPKENTRGRGLDAFFATRRMSRIPRPSRGNPAPRCAPR